MSSSPMPWIIPQFFTNEGEMASFYQLFTYQINSTTKQDTFADSALITTNSNPIVLDQYGRAPIFLSLTSYKFVLATPTASDPPAPADIIWTADNVPAYSTGFANFDITGVAGETIDTDNNVVYLSDGSDSKTPGLWYLTNALSDFSSINAVAIGVAVAPIVTGETGTIRVAGRASITVSTLTVGALYYLSDASDGRVTSTPPAQNIMVLGKADSTSSLIIEPAWGYAAATARGMVAPIAQSFGGVKTFMSQPVTHIGTSTPTVNIGGVFVKDTTQVVIPQNSTDAVGTDSEIPADMLNANGKAIRIYWGSGVASTGAGAHTLSLKVGATIIGVRGTATAQDQWFCRATILRVASDSIQLSHGASDITGTGTWGTPRDFLLTGYDFTAAIDLQTNYTTGAGSTITQGYFIAQAIG